MDKDKLRQPRLRVIEHVVDSTDPWYYQEPQTRLVSRPRLLWADELLALERTARSKTGS